MAASPTFFLTSFLMIFIASLPSSSPSPPSASAPAPPRAFEKIYAFGDSYTDTGNTRSATGPSSFNFVSSPPYGSTFFHRPTNRYSDGRLVIDFVAESLSLPYLPPYLKLNRSADASHGVNFAVAGSTAIPHSFFVRNNMTLNITPQSLQTELLWFDEFLKGRGCRGTAATSPACDAVFEDALVWVGEVGANDYAYSIGSGVSDRTIQALAVKSVTGFLQAILSKGAKYVVVQGLPPSGCLPLAMVLAGADDRDDVGCVASANKQTYGHNMVLQARIQDLRKQFPGSIIAYADYWNAYRTVMKNAGKYGFSEPFKACCGSGGAYNFEPFAACGSPSSTTCSNPAQYINWDGVHLTEAMYKVVANSVLNGPFCHPPFKYLLTRKRAIEISCALESFN